MSVSFVKYMQKSAHDAWTGAVSGRGVTGRAGAAGAILALGLVSACSSGEVDTPTPEDTDTPAVTPTLAPTPIVTPTLVPTPVITPTPTPEPTPTLEEQIRAELEPGRWSTENYEKLVEFLTKYAEENPERPEESPIAVFDADKTMWAGDQGEAPFIYMLRNLKFSAQLPEALPVKITVPVGGLGTTAGGVLFSSSRVQQAAIAMLTEYQVNVDSAATLQGFLDIFSESMIVEGGALATNETFLNAYHVYTGTLLALYLQLDANVGPVGFNFNNAANANALYSDAIHDFYAWETSVGGNKLDAFYQDVDGDSNRDILFPTILDGADAQLAHQAAGEVGSYAQVGVWEALGKTPEALKTLGAEVFDDYSLGQTFSVVVPVDEAGAEVAVPLDFASPASAFAPGASPVTGVIMGTTSLGYGNAVRDEIVNLIDVMKNHGITPVVVTASQTDLVAAVATPVYGIEEQFILGIQPRLNGAVYENWLLNPVTYRPGKVDAVRLLAEEIALDAEVRPVFCAGDSNTDFEFVAYSSDYRLFFDRGKAPLMELATWLTDNGYASTTVVQTPFE